MKRIILTGGGTAGHVTPNIALLPRLKELGYDIHYIGSYTGIEKELIEQFQIPYHGISSGKLRRYFSMQNFTDPFRVLKGFSEANKLIKSLKPDVIFSKGGFVSVPVVMAGKKCHVPTIIHESDMTPGLANKLSIPSATKVCCNFPETLNHLPKEKAVLTGSPIRKELLSGSKEAALKFCGFTSDTGVGVGQKCFLYLEAVSENDYTRLLVYDLNGEAPVKVGELEATGLAGGWYYEAEVFDDPTEFELDTRLEILGTRTGVRTYTISGHTGMPMPKTDYFEISDNGYPMTSLIDLKVRMLDTNAEETIPAGTEFYEIRTDGESYVDFRLNDGRECRIEVDTDGYPDTIDGIPEDECFEGIMYAG